MVRAKTHGSVLPTIRPRGPGCLGTLYAALPLITVMPTLLSSRWCYKMDIPIDGVSPSQLPEHPFESHASWQVDSSSTPGHHVLYAYVEYSKKVTWYSVDSFLRDCQWPRAYFSFPEAGLFDPNILRSSQDSTRAPGKPDDVGPFGRNVPKRAFMPAPAAWLNMAKRATAPSYGPMQKRRKHDDSIFKRTGKHAPVPPATSEAVSVV